MKSNSFKAVLLSFAAALLTAGLVSAQTAAPSAPKSANEVFERFATSAGGKEAIDKVQSRTTRAVFEMPAFGVKAKLETKAKFPGKVRAVMVMDAGKMVRVYDGSKGWVSDPFSGGVREVEGVELEDMRQEADVRLPLNLGKMFPDAKLLEGKEIDGVKMHVVEVAPNGRKQTLYFASDSGLLRRWDRLSVSPSGEMAVSILWDDYRAVDGMKIAHSFKLTSDQFAITVKTEECVHNQAMEDSEFAKPSAP
jgi:outer membrane lipoprotein-sorting protein